MRIVLGLGSNIGDREGRLRQAIASLRKRRVDALRSASLYLTEPRDFEDQPWFINTVVEVETELNPANLLEQCLAVEQEAGRMRDQSRGPRPIDIDILFYNELRIQTPELTVPHPRYSDRRFVLLPLAELLPDFRDPIQNISVQQLIERCPDKGEVRFHAPPLF